MMDLGENVHILESEVLVNHGHLFMTTVFVIIYRTVSYVIISRLLGLVSQTGHPCLGRADYSAQLAYEFEQGLLSKINQPDFINTILSLF